MFFVTGVLRVLLRSTPCSVTEYSVFCYGLSNNIIVDGVVVPGGMVVMPLVSR